MIAAAIAFFVMNQDAKVQVTENTPETAPSAQPTPPPVEVKPEEVTMPGNELNTQALLDKLHRDINRDMEESREALIEQRLTITSELGKELMGLVGEMDSSEQAAAKNAITSYIASIKQDNGKIPANLPAEITSIPGSENIHTSSRDEQRRAQRNFAQKFRENESFYILELETAILKNKDAPANALAPLQNELNRVQSDPSYFKNNILTIREESEE